MADRFYTSLPLSPGEFVLDGAEAHHLAAVRRFGPGDRVTLFNGDGNDYPADVIATAKKTVILRIIAMEFADRELGRELVVASAMPKGDRGDFLIEKLTELGVTRFIPLLTERSIVSPKESRVEALQRAVVEASKVCGRNVLMVVDPPAKWDAVARRDWAGARVILHTAAGLPQYGAPSAAGVIAVGPEGGFTTNEVNEAAANGWMSMSLGPRVLRVETAALAAVAYTTR